MKEKLEALKQKALSELENVSDTVALEQMRVTYLGKKSELAAILKGMAGLSAEERPIIGQLGNSVRNAIEEAFEKAMANEFDDAKTHLSILKAYIMLKK